MEEESKRRIVWWLVGYRSRESGQWKPRQKKGNANRESARVHTSTSGRGVSSRSGPCGVCGVLWCVEAGCREGGIEKVKSRKF